MCWRAHLLWIGQGLAQETRAHPPPIRESAICTCHRAWSPTLWATLSWPLLEAASSG